VVIRRRGSHLDKVFIEDVAKKTLLLTHDE
jgi:hypothetical protein